MKIDLNTEEIENYARKIAIQKIRAQVGDLVKNELEAIKNVGHLYQKISELSNTIDKLGNRVTDLEQKQKRWWKRDTK